MTTFKQFIFESFKNLFTSDEKRKYADEAYSQLISSYEKVGGIHGKGFSSVDDFIENIPFWKLRVKNGKVIAGAYYKDKNGRKRVAIASDGSSEGKKAVADMMISDILQGRAYVEQSGPSLSFLVKSIGYDQVKKHLIHRKSIESVLDDEVYDPPEDDPELLRHPELKSFFYQRYIGGDLHTKVAVGTPGKVISK